MKSNIVFKISFLLVFLVWLMLWVMLPTKTYEQEWIPNLQNKLNSTYIGAQGTNMMLFTFPVMLVAALGCVYLHFKKNSEIVRSKSDVGSRFLSFCNRPILVMAPMGIVTTMELAFVAMFVALLVWSFANYLHVWFDYLQMHKEGQKVWQAKFEIISFAFGCIGNICMAFLFLPVTRGSSILPLIGLTSESSIKYHIWLGHISMVLFAAHSIGYIVYWGMTDQLAQMLEWSKHSISNIAGEIAFVAGLIIWVTTFPRIRRKMFEVFFYTHQIYILFLLFYILHVGIAYFCLVLPGVFLFLIDRYLRFLQSKQRARLVSARILPCGIVELNFSKTSDLNYRPTSILFLNVPSISKMEWHPFTMTSNDNMEADTLSIVVKTEGNWSENLYQQVSSFVDHLEVSVEGPYGPTSCQFLRHESLVMVSGGSGITPFISIIREIIFLRTQPNCHIPQVTLICAFKNSVDLTMLDLILPLTAATTSAPNLSGFNFQIQAYITRERQEPEPTTTTLLRTLRFKPNPADTAISPPLGPNSWLWLGAIISSSFIMFILFLAILTRYYIYPIDHNTNEIYHFSGRALWDIFFICICIFVAATAISLWCKKQNVRKELQIQNMDLEAPIPSVDNEGEGSPHQSLVEATNLHFGARPDLKKLLMERKESDIGVLVCGPKKMRHEVAKICASALAHNLHFESISFNW